MSIICCFYWSHLFWVLQPAMLRHSFFLHIVIPQALSMTLGAATVSVAFFVVAAGSHVLSWEYEHEKKQDFNNLDSRSLDTGSLSSLLSCDA